MSNQKLISFDQPTSMKDTLLLNKTFTGSEIIDFVISLLNYLISLIYVWVFSRTYHDSFQADNHPVWQNVDTNSFNVDD